MVKELEQLREDEISKNLHPKLINRYLAWHRQAKEQKVPWRRLEQSLIGVERWKGSREFLSGTKLLRHYNGEVYEVLILEKGYSYKGREYRSLSAIAKLITGTNWNGNLFFKCKKSSREDKNEPN